MSKEQKEGLVPRLRFPEFENSQAWEVKELGNVCVSVASGNDKIQPDGLFNLYGSTGIIGSTNSPSHDGDFILIARVGANAGFLTRAIGKFGVTDNTVVVSLRDTENTDFIYYSLERSDLNKLVFGSGQPLITGGHLKKQALYRPTHQEQRKISDCLASLDDLITAERAKLEALKKHKKGLMQGLFPAEGETVPSLRFEGFEEVWMEKNLGDVARFSSGGTPSKDKSEYWDGNIPWISASSMHHTLISRSDLHITEVARKNGAATVGEGVLLLLVRGSMLFKRVPVGITTREVAYNQDVKALHLIDGIAPMFLLYCLVAAESVLLGKVTATGIGAGKLDTADLKQFSICIPAIEEQQRIISTISALDDLIAAQSSKTVALRNHKRGLMEGLFPANL